MIVPNVVPRPPALNTINTICQYFFQYNMPVFTLQARLNARSYCKPMTTLHARMYPNEGWVGWACQVAMHQFDVRRNHGTIHGLERPKHGPTGTQAESHSRRERSTPQPRTPTNNKPSHAAGRRRIHEAQVDGQAPSKSRTRPPGRRMESLNTAAST